MPRNKRKRSQRPPPDPEKTFLLAESFAKAALIMNSHEFVVSKPSLVCPMVVNASFSIELYLKCILSFESNKSDGKHNLKHLFGRLDKSTQDVLRSAHDIAISKSIADQQMAAWVRENGGSLSLDLLDMLQDSGDAFENFRYIDELDINSSKPMGFRLGVFYRVVRQYIVKIHPDWLPPTPTSPIH